MKKSFVSIILAGIVVVEFMFLLQYKARADQNEELALIHQTEARTARTISEEQMLIAVAAQREALEQREIAEAEAMRAGLAEADAELKTRKVESLQQQLDKCK